MGLRPNSCYRGHHKPYTRTSAKVQKKDYITGIPGSKITQYEMGKKGGDFDTRVEIVARFPGTIRHNTLEAMRIVASRHLQKIGTVNFFFKIPKFPHHIMRENPMATGAGADRFSQGMRASFGKPIGRATLINSGDVIAYADTSKKYAEQVKSALKRAGYKVGIKTRIIIKALSKKEQEELKKQKAKKIIEAIIEEAPTTEAEEKPEGEEAEGEGETEGEEADAKAGDKPEKEEKKQEKK